MYTVQFPLLAVSQLSSHAARLNMRNLYRPASALFLRHNYTIVDWTISTIADTYLSNRQLHIVSTCTLCREDWQQTSATPSCKKCRIGNMMYVHYNLFRKIACNDFPFFFNYDVFEQIFSKFKTLDSPSRSTTKWQMIDKCHERANRHVLLFFTVYAWLNQISIVISVVLCH